MTDGRFTDRFTDRYADHRRPRTPRLTRTGRAVLAGSVALGLAGWAADYPELVALGVTGALLVASGLCWTAVPPGLEIERRLPPGRLAEGDRVRCVLVVRNPGRRRSRPAEAVEPMTSSAPIPLPVLAPGGQYRSEPYEMEVPHRGRYLLTPPYPRRVDPSGLVRSGTVAGPATEVLVHPRLHRVRIPGMERAMIPAESAAVGVPAPAALSWHSLRPYVPGDDFRLIHWMSTARMPTARSGELLVRQDRVQPRRPACGVILDTAAKYHTPGAFDDAVRIAASVSVAAIRIGVPTSLYAGPNVVTADGGGRGGGELDVLDFLATVATGAPARLPAAPRVPTLLIVVTGQWPPAGWPALPTATPGWAAVTIVVVDPRPVGAGATPALVTRVRDSGDFADRWRLR